MGKPENTSGLIRFFLIAVAVIGLAACGGSGTDCEADADVLCDTGDSANLAVTTTRHRSLYLFVPYLAVMLTAMALDSRTVTVVVLLVTPVSSLKQRLPISIMLWWLRVSRMLRHRKPHLMQYSTSLTQEF